MVVLAASITTRGGKPLLSRQFRELTKDRVLELLSNFQSLVTNLSSEHTFVEGNHVRYVYRPFDDYYIILITNRQSNIIEDLSTLNLLSQTVNNCLSSYDENEIYDSAFEILTAFDEVVIMGYKENLSSTQVTTYLAMESHEERIQEIIERNKEFEATEERKRRAKEIAKREQERRMGIPSMDFAMPPNKFMGSNDPNVTNAYNSYYSHASPAAQQSYLKSQKLGEQPVEDLSSQDSLPRRSDGSSGMKLGGARSKKAVTPVRNSSSSRPSMKPENEEDTFSNNGILILIKEIVNAQISRDGAISSSELKGVLELRINDTSLGHAKLTLGEDVNVKDRNMQFRTHPNIDKNAFLSNKSIGLRSNDKAFPANDQTLGVLRWRKVGANDDKTLIPLECSTWVSPSQEGEGMFEVTVEFEVNSDYNKDLKDLVFTVPVLTENVFISPDNNDCNASLAGVDEEMGIAIKVDRVEPGEPAVFSFIIEAGYEDALFPLNVNFAHVEQGSSSLTGVSVANVSDSQTEDQLPYDLITSLRAEEYAVV
ncbi:hypothetical protein ZYGR_0AN01360 [Zygosaccharomyces rouxii]|uniref:Coatomer subunit delta n=1 Tax=Zygosaccharomyces rouxii TaxID=4956 RepID=A0A1Q3AG45_ZYGRO|nr:hypothetical protein ZYGR_0AN01360 [Zygosaccharomyces rouxii]